MDALYSCIFYSLGVAVGTDFCYPESPAISDSSIWAVTVASGGKYLI